MYGLLLSKFEIQHEKIEEKEVITFSDLLATLSHIVIGGLLTVQISNLWEAYDIQHIKQNLVMSICWMIYALIIFLYGNNYKNRLYKMMGALVLILVSMKVFILI